MLISLGAVMGGPEPLVAQDVWRSLSQRFKAARDDTADNPCLNVVFHFPGSLISPDYTGLRTAKFSRRERTLMVQAAVPPDVASSTDAATIESHLLDCVTAAIELSRDKWRKHNIEYPYDDAIALANVVRG
ncbi:hypothetical protein [Rhodopirellula baltica]